jgi:tetratricopeptide (TPR) repeat protein
LITAGRSAYELGDLPAACRLLSRAEALLPPNDPERCSLLPILGSTLTETGELNAAKVVLDEAVDLARAAADREQEALALFYRLELSMWLGEPAAYEVAEGHARGMITQFEKDRNEVGLARAWRLLSATLGGADAERAGERALSYARSSGDRRTELEVIQYVCGTLDGGPTPVGAALDRCSELWESAKGDLYTQAAIVLFGQAPLQAKAGRFDEARDGLNFAKGVFEDLGLTLFLAAGWAQTAAELELLDGEPAEAERYLDEGIAVLERIGERGYWSSSLALLLSRSAFLQGRLDEAWRFLQRSQEVGEPGVVGSKVLWNRMRARLLAEEGRSAEAVDAARQAVDLEDDEAIGGRANALIDLGEVLALAGSRSEAIACFEEAVGLHERKGDVVSARRARDRSIELAGIRS